MPTPASYGSPDLSSISTWLYFILKGLSGSNTGLGHALVPVAADEEKLDTGNFRS